MRMSSGRLRSGGSSIRTTSEHQEKLGAESSLAHGVVRVGAAGSDDAGIGLAGFEVVVGFEFAIGQEAEQCIPLFLWQCVLNGKM